jgi:hypothetical protein
MVLRAHHDWHFPGSSPNAILKHRLIIYANIVHLDRMIDELARSCRWNIKVQIGPFTIRVWNTSIRQFLLWNRLFYCLHKTTWLQKPYSNVYFNNAPLIFLENLTLFKDFLYFFCQNGKTWSSIVFRCS